MPDEVTASGGQVIGQPTGRQIQVADGDTVVVENDDRIAVVRQRVARVRVVADEGQKTLILLADWAPPGSTEPDGRVNRTWRFSSLEGRWPFDARWEGLVTMRFPDGPFMGPGPVPANVPVITLETSVGMVAFVNGALRSDPPGVDVSLRFGGLSGGGREGASFDEAEREALSPTFMQSFVSTSFTGPGPVLIPGDGGGGRTTSSVWGPAGSPPAQWSPAPPGSIGRLGAWPPILHRVEAEWPQAARDAGVSGIVLLQVAIASDGTVSDVRVERSIPLLDAAAIAAVRQWRFAPAGPDGRPDPLTITVPLVIPARSR